MNALATLKQEKPLSLFYKILNIGFMIIRLDKAFIETAAKLNIPLSKAEEKKLAEAIDSNYNIIHSDIEEIKYNKNHSKSRVIELGNIGTRFFALNIHYNGDTLGKDIPLHIKQLLPVISPIQLNIMATAHAFDDPNAKYLKVGQLYDDDAIYSRYSKEL